MQSKELKKVKHEEVFVPIEAPAMTKAFIIRIIVYVVAFLNAIFAVFGVDYVLTVDGDMQMLIYEGLSLAAWGIAWGHGIWKNNNFTKKARKAQVAADQVKEKDKKGA